MSATDARHLLQEIRDAEDMVEKNRQMKNEKSQRIGELQMVHNKSVCVCGVRVVVCVTLYVCGIELESKRSCKHYDDVLSSCHSY